MVGACRREISFLYNTLFNRAGDDAPADIPSRRCAYHPIACFRLSWEPRLRGDQVITPGVFLIRAEDNPPMSIRYSAAVHFAEL